MDKKINLKKILIYYYYKHHANWLEMENALLSVEKVEVETDFLHFEQKFDLDDYISIFDNDYPENFKETQMPPLVLFKWGNHKLLNDSSILTSLWVNVSADRIIKNTLNNLDVYVMKYEDNLIDEYKKILRHHYKLILIANHYDFKKIQDLTKYENFLFISDVAPDVDSPILDDDQSWDQLLFGISKNLIIFEDDLSCLGKNLKTSTLANKNTFMINIDKLSPEEIKKYNIKKFKKTLN